LIALYQSGVIRHIPEPPLPALDADRVDASAEAFERFEVGDAFLGFVSYGVTKAFCFWCLVAATATFATAPLAIPEARTALARLSERAIPLYVPD
jgi:hypothetical protein